MDLRLLLNADDAVFTPQKPGKEASSTTIDTEDVRAGKWTTEEEKYALTLVKVFLAGVMSLPTGVSLRSFLAKKLRCSRMRISTKLVTNKLGGEAIPRRLGLKRFFPSSQISNTIRHQMMEELNFRKRGFLQSIDCVDAVKVLRVTGSPCSSTLSTSDSDDYEADEDQPQDDQPRRIGSWSAEEEKYAAALIDAFFQGVVNVAPGTTLRAFLADQLSCTPMRVTKKLASGTLTNQTLPKRLGCAVFSPSRPIDKLQVENVYCELARLRSAL
ncbi:hypothetical protein Poli38472_002557 [Pythium oligandrum]|uniref:Uncharacterized protein n=1 Tax=Pythium oligandrum TaxID=41045 RepID=A0A8K1FIA7_PYTOL|nr:hypothetical protein Poli38472_002557 [Pythium oligandrum]|eukprot:TMW63616.1 hypothetical protein Poli38472_002557 [Pythium oligandrum]